jgi:hypothetical protein
LQFNALLKANFFHQPKKTGPNAQRKSCCCGSLKQNSTTQIEKTEKLMLKKNGVCAANALSKANAHIC